jgi:L,D-transpeptidase catalytic domain
MSVLRVAGAAVAPLVLAVAAVLATGLVPFDEPIDLAEPPARETPATAAGTPCRATARACVRLSTNQAWLLRNGRVVVGPVRISHGRAGYRTPTGTFRVTSKDRTHVSSAYDAPMPYSVFFNGGIAFHQGDTRSNSHGCVHLSRDAARTFYATLWPGDVVQVVS